MVRARYASECFSKAVFALATGTGSIRERLHAASIGFAPLHEEDIPDDLRGEYQAILDALTKKEPLLQSEGRVRATLRGMHLKRAQRIAVMIWNLNVRLDTYMREQERLSREERST